MEWNKHCMRNPTLFFFFFFFSFIFSTVNQPCNDDLLLGVSPHSGIILKATAENDCAEMITWAKYNRELREDRPYILIFSSTKFQIILQICAIRVLACFTKAITVGVRESIDTSWYYPIHGFPYWYITSILFYYLVE